MKKFLIFALTILIAFSLASCGESKKETVKDDAFIYEPQVIIDSINAAVEKDGSGLYFTCDSFKESGKSIGTDDNWGRVLLTFDTTDDGLITRCRLYWQSSDDSNVISTAGLYSGTIVNALAPDKADDILNSITNIVVKGTGSISMESNGAIVEFETIGDKNWLDISIKE